MTKKNNYKTVSISPEAYQLLDAVSRMEGKSKLQVCEILFRYAAQFGLPESNTNYIQKRFNHLFAYLTQNVNKPLMIMLYDFQRLLKRVNIEPTPIPWQIDNEKAARTDVSKVIKSNKPKISQSKPKTEDTNIDIMEWWNDSVVATFYANPETIKTINDYFNEFSLYNNFTAEEIEEWKSKLDLNKGRPLYKGLYEANRSGEIRNTMIKNLKEMIKKYGDIPQNYKYNSVYLILERN